MDTHITSPLGWAERRVTVEPEEAYEWGAAIEGRRLGEAMDLMNRLDSLTGYTSPSSRERVQGGEHVEQAALRAELLDRLQWRFSPAEKRVSDAFRKATDERERYALGIVDGLHGEALKKRARLTSKQLRDCRRWLHGLMAAGL